LGIRIVTDSVSDIPKTIAKELGIIVLPLTVTFGKEVFKDGVDISSKEFFKKLKESPNIPFTSQVTPGEFIKTFEDVRGAGDNIIAILMSSQLSGTFNSGKTAKEYVDSENIEVIDSKSVTFGQGLMVIEAARMAKMGYSKEQIVKRVLDMRKNMVYKFLVDDLEYLRRGGRLSSSQAMVGKILSIKPILTMEEGKLVLEDKVRGKKKGIKWIINWIKERKIDLSDKTIGLFHSGDLEGLKALKKNILDNFEVGEILEAEVGAVVGTHAGPGCIAIAFFN